MLLSVQAKNVPFAAAGFQQARASDNRPAISPQLLPETFKEAKRQDNRAIMGLASATLRTITISLPAPVLS